MKQGVLFYVQMYYSSLVITKLGTTFCNTVNYTPNTFFRQNVIGHFSSTFPANQILLSNVEVTQCGKVEILLSRTFAKIP